MLGPPLVPAPLGGYAFSYYVQFEIDNSGLPFVRTLRIVRDE